MIRSLLELEVLGGDRFDAPVPKYDSDRPNLYGGQVAAQALRAAALTVDPSRFPHSLHCHFLRSGRIDVPLVMEVERIRDGRSFTSRGVEARQGGDVILAMLASFQVPEPGERILQPRARVPEPEELVPDSFDTSGTGYRDSSFETRAAPIDAAARADPLGSRIRFWIRSTEPWAPDDPLCTAAYLAYVSDLQTGMAVVDRWDDDKGRFMLASLDHALWFHDWVSPEVWLLVDLRRVAVGGGRGLVLGTIHARDGRHVASFTQELVARVRESRR